MLNSGSYHLVIGLHKSITLKHRRYSDNQLNPGYYIYTGSAMGSLSARLQRYLKPPLKRHWHIDYLLASRNTIIEEIWVCPAKTKEECLRNKVILALPGAGILLPRFGATDCRAGCPAHLVYFQRRPDLGLMKGLFRWESV